MKSRQLEIFHAVYTKGTITEAAKHLNVSQPSVSKVLAHTESQLGFLLFSRFKGRLVPTSEAKIIYSKADKIHKDLNQLSLLTKNLSENPSGLIRLACTPTLGLDFVPTMVFSFSEISEGVKFETHTFHYDEMLSHINEGSIDMGIAFEAVPGNDLDIKKIITCKFVVVASEKFSLPNRTLKLEDLKNVPFANIKGPLSKKLSSFFRKNKFSPNIVTSTDSYFMASSYAKKGLAVSVLDEISANSLCNKKNIWLLEESPSTDIYIILPKKASRSVIEEKFLSYIAEQEYKINS
ncbi:MAG TPA: LysR family transcriptional regulator [SAR86 cluster bacterium]|nr:LysR family transcriptional regulator [SAR86 cluster bacterium]